MQIWAQIEVYILNSLFQENIHQMKGPLGPLCPFVASVVRELSQLPCAGHPGFVLADAAVELLQHHHLSPFYFLLFCC